MRSTSRKGVNGGISRFGTPWHGAICCLTVLSAIATGAQAATHSAVAPSLNFSGAVIWLSPTASPLEQQAAQALQVYCYRVSEKRLPIHRLPIPHNQHRPAIILGTIDHIGRYLHLLPDDVQRVRVGKGEGFLIQIGNRHNIPTILLLSRKPIGALYAA